MNRKVCKGLGTGKKFIFCQPEQTPQEINIFHLLSSIYLSVNKLSEQKTLMGFFSQPDNPSTVLQLCTRASITNPSQILLSLIKLVTAIQVDDRWSAFPF